MVVLGRESEHTVNIGAVSGEKGKSPKVLWVRARSKR